MTRTNDTSLPAGLLDGLLDDAAVFPPGNAPLPAAVPAHREHRFAWYADLVGPLVLPASALSALGPLASGDDVLQVAVTLPQGPDGISAVLDAAADLPVELVALEVAVPDGVAVPELLETLDSQLAGSALEVFVEVPRDARRDVLLAALGGRYRAKFRTGGVRAELYPDEVELAGAVRAAVAAGVSFKATAGLHHAVRNTDPDTGFEQHGFLNLLAAAAAALDDADEAELVSLLSDRDAARVADRVRALSPEVRSAFRSFGTCSVTEPVEELAGLGLLAPTTVAKGVHA